MGGASATRQPWRSASHAASGRRTSWPDALEALKIPTARPRRVENQRVATTAPSTIAVEPRAEADDDAPEQNELPEFRHPEGADEPDLDQREGDDHDALEAVFVDQRRRERRHEAEQHNAQSKRDRDLLRAPAEFLGERNDERAGDAHAAGRAQEQQKDDGDGRPAIVNAGALEPPRQSLSEHEGSLWALSDPPGARSSKNGLRP